MDIEDRLNNLKTDTSNVVVELQTLRELYSQLKICCDTNKQLLVPETLRKEIDNILGEYLGSIVSKKDLSVIIEKLKKIPMDRGLLINIFLTKYIRHRIVNTICTK